MKIQLTIFNMAIVLLTSSPFLLSANEWDWAEEASVESAYYLEDREVYCEPEEEEGEEDCAPVPVVRVNPPENEIPTKLRKLLGPNTTWNIAKLRVPEVEGRTPVLRLGKMDNGKSVTSGGYEMFIINTHYMNLHGQVDGKVGKQYRTFGEQGGLIALASRGATWGDWKKLGPARLARLTRSPFHGQDVIIFVPLNATTIHFNDVFFGRLNPPKSVREKGLLKKQAFKEWDERKPPLKVKELR